MSDWDVDAHRDEHEPEHQWELRRRFLEMHKHSFEEDRLVCLARVMANIEFLGCRYPRETMELVSELSSELVSEFRREEKQKLQRTFVSAASAASDKVNRTNKALDKSRGKKRQHEGGQGSREHKQQVARPASLDLSSFVLVRQQFRDQNALEVLNLSASAAKVDYEIKFDDDGCANVVINGDVVASVKNEVKAKAKIEAANLALEKLQSRFSTLVIKSRYVSQDGPIEASSMSKSNKDECSSRRKCLPQSNIGHKMLLSMGWKPGLGLGVDNSGRRTPITPLTLAPGQKSGLGHGETSSKRETKILLEEYADLVRTEELPADLVFKGFDKDARAFMHKQCLRLGLQSKSFWETNDDGERNRVFVAFKKTDLSFIIDELRAKENWENNKYKLLPPNNVSEQGGSS